MMLLVAFSSCRAFSSMAGLPVVWLIYRQLRTLLPQMAGFSPSRLGSGPRGRKRNIQEMHAVGGVGSDCTNMYVRNVPIPLLASRSQNQLRVLQCSLVTCAVACTPGPKEDKTPS